ncbi:MFS transporter [Novosphingobium profundi]|uniref:MFS transporter n=1 Tax=Novosphingobium profundi TaxID=1774954 RepID=UPI001BDA55B8|nr:MFS transporter [Novosphingobium profundi]MBT0668147.1 MFS transporter [Novosphingobium profundi]
MTPNGSAPAESNLGYPGWRVLCAAVVGLAFSPGPMIFGTFGLFAPHFASDHGWSRGAIMLALTFFNLAGVLASPLTGSLLDRHGVRRLLFPALVALALGFPALAWLTGSLPMFYAIAFAWGATTVATQSISYSKLITGWFVQHRGLAIGIAAAGLGVGYVGMPLIAGALLAMYDWRVALSALAVLVMVVPFLCNLALAHPAPVKTPLTSTALAGLTLGEASRTREFALMAIAILLASVALTGIVPHISLLALDHGLSTGQAAAVASAYGLSTIAGRVLVGWLADHFPVPRVAIAFFACSALGFVLALSVGANAGMAMLILVALTIGLGFGAESDVIALFISRYFGQRAFAAIYGYLLAAFLIGSSIGPALFGFVRDASGSYGTVMGIATALMAAACGLLALLPTGQRQFEPVAA